MTVNSPDEKVALRDRLPGDQYRFVELVEKGRGDWLESSCEKAIRCDVLVISGHFNAGDTFYSDRVEGSDHLSVDALERASCSGSCPALFSRLKEVYLFGCESLNPDASKYASSYGESGRDRMRRIFAGVPVIYGFSSTAPVGPTAAMLLHRHFDAGASDIGTGRASPRLLGIFSRNHMTVTRGVPASAGAPGPRHQVCQFYDERLSPAQKLAFVHAMLRRDLVRALASLERIDALLASLSQPERQSPAFLSTLAGLSADVATRERYLAAQRATADATLRARMIALAASLGWLTAEERAKELAGMMSAVLAKDSVGLPEVSLACSLDDDWEWSGEPPRQKASHSRASRTAATAVLACLGNAPAHARTLAALSSPDDRDVQVAQVYLRHRPVSDRDELRALARDIARMPESRAQVRALDTLGRLHIVDREIVEDLARTFATAESVDVQRAIAEIFLRSGPAAIAWPELAPLLRRHRIPSSDRGDLVEVLIRRLQEPS